MQEESSSESFFAIFSLLETKLDPKHVKDIVTSAVDVENEFITEALSVDLLGMNAKLMTQYIQYTADRLLEMLGVETNYNVPLPFDFMNLQSLTGKTNFFEKRVGEYQTTTEREEFTLDADF